MTIACCEWPCLLLTHYVKLSYAIIAHSDLIFHLPKWLSTIMYTHTGQWQACVYITTFIRLPVPGICSCMFVINQ